MTGTAFAQVLIILVSPILTRLYSPKDFGVFALYTSILGILAVVACWRYELAIVLPEKDEDAANLLVLSIIINIGMSLLVLMLVALFRQPVANLVGAPELAPWLWFMPLSLLAAGLFQAFNYWSTRRKQFKRLAARQITQSTVMAGTQMGFGLVPHLGPGGLIAGNIIGQSVATGRLAGQILKEEGKSIKEYTQKILIGFQFKRYKDFPLYSTWAGLLNTASVMLPALLLGYFFNPTVVGFYALGHKVLSTPMGVIGSSVGQVFFPQASEARRKGTLDKLAFGIFKRLLIIGFTPILLISICAPDLFAIVFGSEWWQAGEYIRWLAVWLLFVFISSPLSTLYAVLERQRTGLIVNVIMFISRLLALVIGGWTQNAHFTIAIFGITGAVLWIFNCFYIMHLAGIQVTRVFAELIRQLIKTLLYAAVPLVIGLMVDNSVIFVATSVTSGLVFLLLEGRKQNILGGR